MLTAAKPVCTSVQYKCLLTANSCDSAVSWGCVCTSQAREIFSYFDMGNCIQGEDCSVEMHDKHLKKTLIKDSVVNQQLTGTTGQIVKK